MKKYYLHNGIAQEGPFNIDELKEKNISKETSIWFEGLTDWTTAVKVDELKDLFETITPPPFAANTTTPPPIQKPTDLDISIPEQPIKKKNRRLIWGGISIATLVIIIVIAVVIKKSPSTSPSNDDYSTPSSNDINAPGNRGISSPPPREKTEEELKQELYRKEADNPLNYLTVNYTWRVNLISNTIIEGNIVNDATVARFKNVAIRVKFYSKTDVLLGQEDFTVMEFVPASGGKAYFRHKISGWWPDVASSKYTLLSAEPY